METPKRRPSPPKRAQGSKKPKLSATHTHPPHTHTHTHSPAAVKKVMNAMMDLLKEKIE